MTHLQTRIAEASAVRPSRRQLAWQQLEFYGFIHFGMNTMTDREWGLGHENPALFDPAKLDADQWVESLAMAGMRGVILTCKHHDGFCLWPSALTTHSVASSPWRDGRGDVVGDVARACQKAGLKFGIYLSPWDRTEQSYGEGAAYDAFFLGQLSELLTNYGPIFSVWFDGANGEGPNGKTQLYDWQRYFALVRDLQPDAVISICGPDVRWCGNEAGHTRKNEWSVVPASLQSAEYVASRSQQADDKAFSRQVRSDEQDLGSRKIILQSEDQLVWYPAEVNTSIRPGWFHHPAENDKVRSVDELFEIYCSAVGGNATFLLNVPPGANGLVSAPDREVLGALGERIKDLETRRVKGISLRTPTAGEIDEHGVWSVASADQPPCLTLELETPSDIEMLILEEDIAHGQQIDGLEIACRAGAEEAWQTLTTVECIGYRRMITCHLRKVLELRLTLTQSRGPVRLKHPVLLHP